MITKPEQIRRASERLQRGEQQLTVLSAELPRVLEPFTENGAGRKTDAAFCAAVYNMETGNRLDRIIPYFLRHPLLSRMDVIFANELDWGMKRSGNGNTTEALAKKLSMNYVYGVEFVTANAGINGNGDGLHGNAILSRYPLLHTKILHLPVAYNWFFKAGDSRLGMRNAVLAEIDADGRRVGLCSVHLENRTDPAGRAGQMAFLLEEIDRHFGDIPVLIGGDMNTNTINGNDEAGYDPLRQNAPEQARRMRIIPELEPLMELAVSHGYDYRSCNLMDKVTRKKPFPNEPDVSFNLDWFFSRGLTCDQPAVVDSVFDHACLTDGAEFASFDGELMSDHNAVTVHCRV